MKEYFKEQLNVGANVLYYLEDINFSMDLRMVEVKDNVNFSDLQGKKLVGWRSAYPILIGECNGRP